MTKPPAVSGFSATSACQPFCLADRSLSPLLEVLRNRLAWSRRVFSFAAAVLVLCASGVAAQAQYTLAPAWTQQSPTNSPPNRYIDAMAYDSAHGQVVLFGGFGGSYLNDTWLWTGNNWTQANPATVPPARAAFAMAYDPVHGQVVMFGGLTGTGRIGDTWLWNGTNWTQASPANSPPARGNEAMVYDPATSQLLLFGGVSAGGTYINDTWVWDGTNWIQQSPVNSPAARAVASIAYDAATSQVVLFGGSGNSGDLNDTWVWNGTNWIQQSPVNSPSARDGAGMDYDPATNQIVLFGGEDESTSTFLNDTWLWNGTNWTQDTTAVSPPARVIENGMVYDTASAQMVLFGGYNNNDLGDTWEFGPPGNFGNVNVCTAGATTPAPCSATISFAVNISTLQNLGTPQVLTQGTTGLDFTLSSGSTCSGVGSTGSCVVNATFTPTAPGVRTGAVQLLFPGQAGIALNIPVYGVGQGPAAAIGPGVQANVPITGLSQYTTGVAVDAAGNTFVADYHSAQVVKVTPGGVQTAIPAAGLINPVGVAIDGTGNVYIVDFGLPYVVMVTPSGVQSTLGSGLAFPIGIALDGAGDVFVGDRNNNRVVEITPGGVQTTVPFTGLSQPWGVAVDTQGDVFVADGGNSRVVEVTRAGVQTTVPATGLSQPYDIVVDAAGDVYIADPLNGRVVEVPAGGGPQTTVATGLAYPSGVAVDGAGDVFIGDQGQGHVFEINRSQPPSIFFATTNVGSTSSDSPKSVALQDIGNQPLNAVGSGLVIVGADFAQVAGSGTPADCSPTFTLTPGQACNLSIRFTPQSLGNPLTGSVGFFDNALNSVQNAQGVGLAGTGVSPTFALNVVTMGNGTGTVTDSLGQISCAEAAAGPVGTCTGNYASGSTITLTATATNGSTFAGWGGACANSATNATCNVLVTQAENVTATFNAVQYALTVTEPGTGTGTVSDSLAQISCIGSTGACSSNYSSGTAVTLTASASGSSVFVGWGGACASFGASPTCLVTMTSALNVSASFVAPGISQTETLAPITAGVLYGQGGSFTSNTPNNGGVSASSLNFSQGIYVDAGGNLYVADGNNNRVLFYPSGSTTATRVYGQNGSFTSNGAGVTANSFNNPQAIAVDSGGNVYISDEDNNRVLYYPAGSTTATRVYGQGGSFTSNGVNMGGVSANSLADPVGIVLDGSGNLYVADYGNSRVLFYPAGSTTATRVYGQGGSFTSNTANLGGISANSLNQAQSVALDSSGDLYVADIYNNRVLVYPANSTTATQVYGQGGSFTSGLVNNGGVSANSLNNPLALTVDSNGGLYVVDRSNNRVMFYAFGSTTATRVYGQGGNFNGSAQNNGGVTANSLNQPWGVAVGGGNVYIADYGNNRVLGFGSFGNVSVCPTNQGTSAPCSTTFKMSYAPSTTTTLGATQVVTQGAGGLDFTLGTGGTCTGTIAAGNSCTVNVNFTPLAPGLRSGAVELFNSSGNPVAATQIYSVGEAPAIAFGPGTLSIVNTGTLSTPKGVLFDAAGNLFVSDTTLQEVIKIAPNGTKTTVGVGLQFPQEMAEDGAGNLYIADNNLNEVVVVPAGCTSSNCQQVLGSNLRSQLGVAVDGAGDVFIGDFLDGEVVKSPAGCTTSGCQTVVYSPGAGSSPVGITVDSAGDLFVADFGLKQVVEVPAGCTTAGCQIIVGTGWSQPDGVVVDAAGDVFVADAGLDELVEVPVGCTPATAGCQLVIVSGINTVAVTADAIGDLFTEDFVNQRVLEINRSQTPSLSFATTNVGSTSADSPQTVILQNVGNQTLTGTPALNFGGNFTQSSSASCPSTLTLAPGAVCGQNFSFTPQSATFLSGSAVYIDNSLDLASGVQTITLSGTGAVGGVAGTVTVPNVVGQAQAAVSAPIAAVGLAMGTVTTASSSTVASGSVISQSPAAGTQVAVGTVVDLLVSTGIAQPVSPNPLTLENNYFVTGDYVSAGVTLRGKGVSGTATGSITIPSYTQSPANGVPDGADIIDAFLYWETLENTPFASSTNGTFNGYPIVGQQIGNDLPNYVDGQFTGTIRAYRASVNVYLPVSANGIRIVSGTYTVGLPDGATALPLTEGASLVMVYRVLSPNFPLKSVVLYDGSAAPTVTGAQVVQGFYDAVNGANGTGKSTNIFASNQTWNNSVNTVTLGASNQYSAPLNPLAAYTAVILSTPVNNSDNDGILDAWKTGPGAGDFHAGQPGYYDAKTATWVGLPGAKHGEKDLFVQLDYMCGAVLANGSCDPTQENLFPSPDANGNDPLAMVQQAFANSGVQLHLQIGNIVPESTCVDGTSSQLCQFPGSPGVVGWKNSLEFSKLYPRNVASCLTGGDCTTRYPYGQKDSYHYLLMGHSLAIPAWNTRYATLTSITVVNGVTTIVTVDRGTGINACPSRITLGGVIGNPSLNGVYNTTGCADTKTITVATPGVPNWSYPNNNLPEPVIGLTSGTISSISGYSDLGGADSAVTLGLWLTAPNQDMSKRANVLAGTIFHEIGHTLGLSHGGLYYDTPNSYIPTFDANCKPNYQSVMNYLFQLDLLGPSQTVAYSNQTLASINENTAGAVTQLTDGSGNAATFPTSAWYVPYTAASPVSPATLHCDGTPLNGESGYRVNSSVSPITPAWSNGQDLSFIGTLQPNERGYNDLANMDLRQVGATGGEFASLASVLSFGSSVSPLNIGANGNVTLGSGGTIALGSGGTVTLGSGGNVTLGSGGVIALGSGGTVTLGSGGNVTLGSGGTVTPGSSGLITLGSGGTIALGSGGTITLGSGGTIALGSGGNVTLGSGGVIALGSGGSITVPPAGGTYAIDSNGGTITLGSGGNVTLGSGGNVTLGSGGVIALGSGGTVTLGSGGNVTLGSGGTIALGSGGTIALGSGGNVTLGSGGTIALGSGGTITLGSGGNVTLGSGGTVTLGSGGNVALGSGGNVTVGSGGSATLGAGGTVTLGSGGNVTLGSGGNVTLGNGGTIALGSGGTVALGSGGNVTLGSGGVIALGSGGTVTLGSGGTVTLGSGGTITLGSGGAPIPISAGGSYTFGSSGGTVTLGSGGNVTLGSGGNITLGSGGTIALGSGGTVTLGSGGNVTLGSGGTITLGSGGTITLGSGGNVTLGSGGVVTLGSGGSVTTGNGSDITLATVNNITPASAGPSATTTELTYETANSVVRPPSSPTETSTPAGVRITWNAPAFGVVQTYTIYRSSNGATPIVIGSVSGVNGNPPATEFTDTNPDLTSKTVVYTVTTTLVPDTAGPSRSSVPSPPAVIKNDQSIVLGALPSSVLITNPPTVTATAMSGGVATGLQVVFSATGACSIGSQSIASNISSAVLALNSTGSCTVTASQPGTTGYNAANSVSGTFTVLPQGSSTKSQTINFPTLPNVQYGSSFTLSATSSAGLPITFAATGPCTKYGTVSGVGMCTITASSVGNGTYSAASLSQSFTVYPAVLKVTATNLSVPYKQPIPTLTYSYSGFVNGDPSSVVIGAPGLSTTATATSNAGSYPITVSTGTLATTNYSFLYVSGTLTVQPANQAALTLIVTSPLTYGQSETLSVTGGTTGGAVSYSAPNSSCSITGARLTANSGTGACTVTATMAGNTNYNAVTSAAKVVTLSLASQVIAFTTNPPASAAYKASFTVAANGGASGNPVTFTNSGACSNSGATYTMTNSVGTCSVIANQMGNTNYAPATQVIKTVTASGPLLSLSTSSINFGTVYLGSISAQVVTVTNIGTAPATITDPILSILKGGNSSEYIALSLCPTTLAAGKNCIVLIGFIAGPYYGSQTATLQIMSNAPGSPQPVALSSTVIDPQASLNPSSLNFGTIKHATTSSMNVTLRNPGGTALSLTGISVTGTNATSFVQSNTCGSSLAAGASCTVAVKFTPASTGTFDANLTVVDNAQCGGGTQTVALTGKGN